MNYSYLILFPFDLTKNASNIRNMNLGAQRKDTTAVIAVSIKYQCP